MMKKMNQATKRLLSLFIAITVMLTGIAFTDVTAKADVSASTLATNDTWVADTISTKGEVDYYSVTLTKAGWLTVMLQGNSVEASSISVWSSDLSKKYGSDSLYGTSDTNPKTTSFTMALEPGTYMVKIKSPWDDTTGGYRVKASFEAANNTESSDDNSFDTAEKIKFGDSIDGFISMDDTQDFFQFELTGTKTIRLILTAYFSTCYMQIYDHDYLPVKKISVYGSSTNQKTEEYEATLDAGLYYVKIYPYSSDTGKYTLKFLQKVMTSKIKISGSSTVVAGKTLTLSAKISPSNASDKTIQWTSGDSSIASVDSDTGKVTAKRAGLVYITASAKDGSNVSKKFKLIVKPKKMTAPTLYTSSYSSRQLRISYSYQSGVTGYQIQYAKNKSFKSAKTKKTKNTVITLKNLSKKKYYVKVRAYYKKGGKYYYGAWSKVRSKKVK